MTEAETIVAVGVVLIPLIVMWVFALFNIVVKRSDLSIVWKGIWSAVVILIPYIGVLIYAIVRPPAPVKNVGDDDTTATTRAIDQIYLLVANHESGAVTDEQFATEKAGMFGIGKRPPTAA